MQIVVISRKLQIFDLIRKEGKIYDLFKNVYIMLFLGNK